MYNLGLGEVWAEAIILWLVAAFEGLHAETKQHVSQSEDLIQALSTTCSLSDDETLLVAEVYNNNILHFMDKPGDSLELVRDHDRLVAYRLLKEETLSETQDA